MLTAEQAWLMLEEAALLVPSELVERAIERVAGEITAEFRDRYPLLLCVMNGAVFFCGKLLPLLHFPLHFDYVHASRYGEATQGRQVLWRGRPPPPPHGPPAPPRLPRRGAHGQAERPAEAGAGRLRRPRDRESVRVRLRPRCPRLLAQSPGDLRAE